MWVEVEDMSLASGVAESSVKEDKDLPAPPSLQEQRSRAPIQPLWLQPRGSRMCQSSNYSSPREVGLLLIKGDTFLKMQRRNRPHNWPAAFGQGAELVRVTYLQVVQILIEKASKRWHMVNSVIHITENSVQKSISKTHNNHLSSVHKELGRGVKGHRWRSRDSGPPRSLPSRAGAEPTEIPNTKWHRQAPSKGARRQAVVNGWEWGMDPACQESRKEWQPEKTGKSGKTSPRRQSWSAPRGDGWWVTISLIWILKEHPPKGKGGLAAPCFGTKPETRI